MLASVAQLDRWRRLLDAPPPATPTDVPALRQSLAGSHGRGFITAAVAAVGLLTEGPAAGVALADLPPLPVVPVRRSATEGAAVADATWLAYARWRFGDAAAEAWLRSLIDSFAPTALVFTINDNPEPWWQNEMVILHAVHSFALRLGDASVIEQSLACADFHLREIQPDHATNEPWAVHAYGSHSDGNVTAETLLHAGFIQHGGTLGPVARSVARDAGSALAAYLKA